MKVDSDPMTCTLCGERTLTSRLIWGFDAPPRPVSKTYTKGVRTAHRVDLDVGACEECSARIYKHLKRMFSHSAFKVS